MVKKGKKGGKDGKKKQKAKKPAEPEMTWKEAFLAYQINIKERELEDAKYELRAVQDKNSRHKERNDHLKAEQEGYFKDLVRKAKEFEQTQASKTEIQKLDVLNVLRNKWDSEKKEEISLSDIQNKAQERDEDLQSNKREVEDWNHYRDHGANEHAKQIQLLEQELIDMQNSHDEMTEHLTRASEQSKEEIQEKTESTLGEQKHLASEKAVARMDKNIKQEVSDHEWLRCEVEIHRREADQHIEAVEDLERANLKIMSELFECTVEDLKISRNFFLTQFEDSENLEESGSFEMDLGRLAITDISRSSPGKVSDQNRDEHRGSETQRYIEDKVFSMTSSIIDDDEEDGEEPNDNLHEDSARAESAEQNEGETPASGDEDTLNKFHFEDSNLDDYLHLGPLELKLLSVAGRKIVFSRPKEFELKPKLFPEGAKLEIPTV